MEHGQIVNAQNQSSVPNQFIRTNSQDGDAGTYRYTVTNSWVPNLSFESGPIEVLTSDAPVTSVNALYNGIITSVRWRTDKAYGTSEEDYSGMYVYEYDDKYQIKDASWASQDLAGAVSFENKFRLTGMEYDPNGNIMALKRYNTDGHKIHNFNYQYGFEEASPQNNNKLKSIDGYVNAYTYNALGQMVGEDKTDGNDQYVEYDVTGKVTKVYSSASKLAADLKVENIYDDRGFRLAKINFATQRTTWYVRDASGNVISIYEQEGVEAQSVEGVEPVVTANGIVQTEVPLYGSGKLATYYPAQDASVSYEITDHLGNVRALLREGTMVFTATMEDNNREDISNPRVAEMAYFQNLFETEVDDVNMNHTSPTATVVQNPSRSAYLFWQDGVPGIQAADKSTGPAIAREVSAGDIIKAEAFVRYENKLSYTRGGITLGVLSTLLGSSFTTVGLFEGSTLSQTTQIFNDALTLEGFLDDNDDETRPFAYISYIVFNESKVSIASDRVRVSLAAGFDPSEAGLANQHEHLQFENDIVIAPEGKYIYLWVSNESEDTRVWFDDFTVTHQSTFVAQATDYGVWGDVLREQRSDVLEKYRYAYQGQFAEKDEETGWSHFELREYDANIGRWIAVDPMRQFFSPYVGMGNKPVSGVDPNGGTVLSDFVNAKTGERVHIDDGIDRLVTVEDENWNQFLSFFEISEGVFTNPYDRFGILEKFGSMSYWIGDAIDVYNFRKNENNYEFGAQQFEEGGQAFINPNRKQDDTSHLIDYVQIYTVFDPRENGTIHFHYSPLVDEDPSQKDLAFKGNGVYNIVISPSRVFFFGRGKYKTDDFGRTVWEQNGVNFSVPRNSFNR